MWSRKYDYPEKLSFITEYYEPNRNFYKTLILNYYPYDNTISLFDVDTNRIFLKRIFCDGVTGDAMFVGNIVRVFGRLIIIKNYADEKSRCIIGNSKDLTVALIKPPVLNHLGEILTLIEEHNFQILGMRMCTLTRLQALEYYEYMKGDHFLPFIIENVVSGPVVAIVLVGENALEKWKDLMGPRDPHEARKTAPQTLRAMYGLDRQTNGFGGTERKDLLEKERGFFFPQVINRKPPATTVRLENSTCCIIKPHVVAAGKLGCILKFIDESQFYVSAMQMFYLSNDNADEVLEVYKGLVSDFHSNWISFVEGPCVALEISGKKPETKVHEQFKKFVGPADPYIARQINPYTLRATFGIDKYRNAVHTTLLEEDTVLELEYFFKIIN